MTDTDITQLLTQHLENTLLCTNKLGSLFLNLNEPEPLILEVKRLEESGDALMAQAYRSLESLSYSDFIYIEEQFIRRLDDIVDGLNKTARLIDICRPRQIEHAAQDILANLTAMVEKLKSAIAHYPEFQTSDTKQLCKELKEREQNADLIYHEWRKKQRRVLVLSLIEENNWTEILGVLEQTTDSAYHAGLLMDRMGRQFRNVHK